MIVICTKCQAKFRIPDDRVGPRGAKVRCSKCQTVFLVQPGVGTVASADAAPSAPAAAPGGLDLELGTPAATRAPVPRASPFPPNPVAAGAPPGPPPLPARAPAAPPRTDRAEPYPPFGGGEPFAAPAPDPFGAADPADAFGGEQADPFGAHAPDPFADPFPDDPFAAPSRLSPPEDGLDGGLSLEDRTTPAPIPARRAADAPPAAHAPEPFLAEGGAFDPSTFDLGGADPDPSLTLDRPPEPARGDAARADLAVPPAPRAPAPLAAPAADTPAREGRVAAARGSRVRAVVVNAVALAALLVAALAMLVVWRTEGPLDRSSLRPAAVLGALRRSAAPGPFAARDVRSGLYDRERGPPVLFVRGSVLSRAAGPVAGVRVGVEVVRGGRVIARGEALAGAVPTPEELHAASDSTALAGLAREIASRAPREVRPGDTLPFLVAIADHPADLDGASLRIALDEAGGAGP